MCHWEPLGREMAVLVSDVHRFNTDTLLLADFSLPKPRQRCADLGSGCGAIPLLWCARSSPASVLALELDKGAAELMQCSVRENRLADMLHIVCGDIREYKMHLPHQGLDLIACNPPYFTTGQRSSGSVRSQARHADTMTLYDLAEASRYALTNGGRLCLCLPVERMAEAMTIFSQRGLEPKRMRLVQSRPGRTPYLFLLECRKCGGQGLRLEPTLLLCGEAGGPTPELLAVYGDYSENHLHGGTK